MWPLTLCPLFLSINILLCLVAKFEYNDLINFTEKNDKKVFYYYNLHHNIWNEWGLLNFVTKSKYLPIDNITQLDIVLKNKSPLIFPDKKNLDDAVKIILTKYPKSSFEIKEWKRWKTRGKDKAGNPMWIDALTTKNLDLLSKKSYLLKFNT